MSDTPRIVPIATDTFPIPLEQGDSVSGRVYRAAEEKRLGATLMLGHGAGVGQDSPFMVRLSTGLAERGVNAVTFNFPYMEHRKRVPDPNERLERCYLAAIASVRALGDLADNPLFIGGKSLGGRIASQVAAREGSHRTGVRGLVFLGYPLHPPGRPTRLRTRHLSNIRLPMLFVQGSRDAFGTPEELRAFLEPLEPRPRLFVIDGGDHSLSVPQKWPVSPTQVFERVLDEIAGWIRDQLRSTGSPSSTRRRQSSGRDASTVRIPLQNAGRSSGRRLETM